MKISYLNNTLKVTPLLPCFDRFLVISIFERKKGGGCRRGNLFNYIDLSKKLIANFYSFIYTKDLYKSLFTWSKIWMKISYFDIKYMIDWLID